MFETAGGVGKLVLTGVALAIGFWTARKFTDKVDFWLAKRDKKLMAELLKDEGQSATAAFTATEKAHA